MISGERLNGIRAFVQATDAGSFSQAAARLGLSKSAVGKAIARLERRLNVRLFHRTTRSLSLTDEGHTFYASCVRALLELENAEAALAARFSTPAGRLRVSLPTMFGTRWVMPVLLELTQLHEAMEIEATFTNRQIDFAENGIDLVVCIGEFDAGAHLTARRLGTQKLAVCGSPAYFATHGHPQSVDALVDHACIGLFVDGKVRPWQFRGTTGAPRFAQIRSRLRIGHVEAIAAAACAGYGIAQLPAWFVADAIRSGILESTLAEEQSAGMPVHVVWPATRVMPLRLRVAVDALVESFTPYAPWEAVTESKWWENGGT